MLKGLVALVLVVGGWVGALWFWIAPEFAPWSLPQLAAMHALPPLGVSAFWLGGRSWLRVRAERHAEEAEALAAAEQQAGEDAARHQAEAEIAKRRFGCDCRAVAMAQVSTGDDGALFAGSGDGVHFSEFDLPEREAEEHTTLIAHLLPGLEEALGAIYERCAAALALPIYVTLPGDARGDEFVAAVRGVQRSLADREDVPGPAAQEPGRVYQLPAGKRTLDGVMELFERTPGLAAVFLGSDSPWLRAASSDEETSAIEAEKAGQGVFAVLLTHPELSAEGADLAPGKAEALLSLPILARIHRPASAELGGKRLRAKELARTVAALMAEAQLNAGLGQTGENEKIAAPEQATANGQDCAWLVHNSGGVDSCGARLAGIGVALAGRGVDLDPVGEATNVSVKAGDLGEARGVGMLALAVAQAAATQGASLCVEFCGDEAVSLFFARPPEGAVPAVA